MKTISDSADSPGPLVSNNGPSLLSRLAGRDNALNFIRIFLASLVIFGHAFPLMDVHPRYFGAVHAQALDGFFAISGFLILSSGMRMRTVPYLWRRFLRIYPGYMVALFLTAFMFAPLGATMETGAHWQWRSAVRYITGALDLRPSQDGIEFTLLHTPLPGVWNGSLWTLFYEFLAYLGVAALCITGFMRRHLDSIVPAITLGATVITTAWEEGLLVLPFQGSLESLLGSGLRLWTFFSWGMLLRVVANRLPASRLLPLASLTVFVLLTQIPALDLGFGWVILYPLLTYGVLGLGATLPIRWGTKNDISYGIYIYAFPTQQLLVLAGFDSDDWVGGALCCLAISLILGLLSWKLVELPCTKMRSLIPARMWGGAPISRRSQ